MSDVPGKAYAMTVLTPMPPRRIWVNALLFSVTRLSSGTLAGLKELALIHFARWVVIRRRRWPRLGGPPPATDYMLFCSNFNGAWDQYIDGIPNGLDLFWYASDKYPHSIAISHRPGGAAAFRAALADYPAAGRGSTYGVQNAPWLALAGLLAGVFVSLFLVETAPRLVGAAEGRASVRERAH